jgi:hypothetical protein
VAGCMIWYARRRDCVKDWREMGGWVSVGGMGVARYSRD